MITAADIMMLRQPLRLSHKLCSKCGKLKSLDEFYTNGTYRSRKKSGVIMYRSACKQCENWTTRTSQSSARTGAAA